MSKSTKATKKSTKASLNRIFKTYLMCSYEHLTIDEDNMQDLMITNLYDKGFSTDVASDIMSDCNSAEYDLLYDSVIEIAKEFFTSKGYTCFSLDEIDENCYTFLKGQILEDHKIDNQDKQF